MTGRIPSPRNHRYLAMVVRIVAGLVRLHLAHGRALEADLTCLSFSPGPHTKAREEHFHETSRFAAHPRG